MIWNFLCSALIACSLAADVLQLHVSPLGSDDNPGTLEAPFRSPTGARDALRRLRRDIALGSEQPVEVLLLEGIYSPLLLEAEDSGSSAETAVTYLSAPGARATISAGVALPASAFSPAPSMPGVFIADIPSAAGELGDIVANEAIHECANSKVELFFSEKRMTLARYPNVNADAHWALTLKGSEYTQDWGSIELSGSSEDVFTITSQLDDYCNKEFKIPKVLALRQNGAVARTLSCANQDIVLQSKVFVSSGIWNFMRTKDVVNGTCFSLDAGSADAARVAGWSKEASAWMHGYWEWDWADAYRKVSSIVNGTDGNVQVCWQPSGKGDTNKKSARFYGLNLLSELDAPGEYFIDRTSRKLYFYPPRPVGDWGVDTPFLSSKLVALEMSNTQHVRHKGLTIAHAKEVGVHARNVTGVVLDNCTISGHGTDGVVLVGTNSSIVDSIVRQTGCGGLRAHGGDALTLSPGGLTVRGNEVNHHGMWKRTYMPGIHWGGVANTYSHNIVSFGAHNCILGGGNEVRASSSNPDDSTKEIASVDNVFEYNVLDTCAFEASDTGAFYTCGQEATAWINRGNVLRHSTFRNVRNIGGGGVQSVQVQAVYLDDQMSGWELFNNSFINCQVGTFAGGGRRNIVHQNYYESCDTAHHFDNRGMNWQKGSCDCSCGASGSEPFSTQCDPCGVAFVLNGPAGESWGKRWPELKAIDDACIPEKNEVRDNVYRACGRFTDQDAETYVSWGSTLTNNTELSDVAVRSSVAEIMV